MTSIITPNAEMSAAAPRRGTLSRARLDRLQRAVLSRVRARGFSVTASLAILLGVIMALLHVSVRLRVIRVGYALSQETQIRHNLMEHNQRLRLELAARKDPATIERIARERLKMTPPDPGAIRVIRAQVTPGSLPESGQPGPKEGPRK